MNVQEVLNISKERKARNKVAIKGLVERIHNKIRYHATMNKDNCVYIIPPVMNDMPLYDIQNTIIEVFKILDNEGFIVTAYPNGQLEINWNEALVEKKANSDAFVLKQEERRLKNLTNKAKKIDERFSFLANPSKVVKKNSTIEDKLNIQVEKILNEKDKLQQRYSKML
jgi:hypothetical protein